MAQMDGRQIYENFTLAPGPSGYTEAEAALARLQERDLEIGNRIRMNAASLEEAWEGDAAGAAQRGAGPLAVDHEVTSEHVTTAQGLAEEHVGAFDRSKSSVVPVPEVPPGPPSMVELVNDPAGTQSYFQQKQAALSAVDHNVQVMDSWDVGAADNEARMPEQYGNDFAPSFARSTDQSRPGSGVDTSGANGPGIGAGAAPVTSGLSGVPGGSTPNLPRNPSDTEFAARLSGDNAPDSTTRTSATSPTTTSPTQTPYTRPDAPTARPTPGYTPGPLSPVAGRTSDGPGRPGSGPGAGRTAGGPPGAGRGSGPGAGRTAGGPLGAGRAGGQPGAQQPGRMTGAQPGAGRVGGGAPGAAGRGGMAGMGRGGMSPGMMGGAGGRGQGGEDEEHKNKYAAKEQLDDGLIREDDEFGERVIDEQTGKSVLSPVIGADPEPQPPTPQQNAMPPVVPGAPPQAPQGAPAPPTVAPVPVAPKPTAVPKPMPRAVPKKPQG